MKTIIPTIACIGAVSAHAAIVWNESANGDLSNNGLTPTAMTMALGSNRVIGTTGNNGSGVDRDYFTFTVPPGMTLAAVKILDNTYVSGGASFIGVQAGPQITVSPSGAGADQLLGYTHYSNDLIGSDILPRLVSAGSVPLAAGAYSIWVQETGGPVEYGFEFILVAASESTDIPTLPEWGMLLLGSSLAFQIWRRNRNANAFPV